MPEPLAYFLTWATYGTWLPGDGRGWIDYRHGWQLPDSARELESRAYMTETACRLRPDQRALVESTVADHCHIRGWELYAVNCRSNHLHVVVAAPVDPDAVRVQFKSWCTRRLRELELDRAVVESTATSSPAKRVNWWAERGSRRYINDEESLEAAILYVRDGQDRG